MRVGVDGASDTPPDNVGCSDPAAAAMAAATDAAAAADGGTPQQQQPQPQPQPAPPGDAGADSTGVVAASTTADDAAAAAAEVAAAAEGGEEAVQTTSEEPEDQARAHAEAHAEAQAQLVESENVTALKAMLNTEGVLGDVRVNAELCEFLRLDENIDAMLDLCLQGFTEEDVQRSEELFATVGGLEHLPERFRLAYVAAEILSSEPFCDPLHDLTEGHLDKLFSFLDFPYMNSWLSLRIFECIHRILTNRPSLFLHYIARRQARDGSFMRTLTTAVYWSPFADLLSALIIRESEDTPSQWWLENGVVEHVAELAEGKHIPPAADAYQRREYQAAAFRHLTELLKRHSFPKLMPYIQEAIFPSVVSRLIQAILTSYHEHGIDDFVFLEGIQFLLAIVEEGPAIAKELFTPHMGGATPGLEHYSPQPSTCTESPPACSPPPGVAGSGTLAAEAAPPPPVAGADAPWPVLGADAQAADDADDDDDDDADDDDDDDEEGITSANAKRPPVVTPHQQSQQQSQQLQQAASRDSIIMFPSILQALPSFATILEGALPADGRERGRFGMCRLGICELVAALARQRCTEVHEALVKTAIVAPTMLALAAYYDSHNILQAYVTSVFHSALPVHLDPDTCVTAGGDPVFARLRGVLHQYDALQASGAPVRQALLFPHPRLLHDLLVSGLPDFILSFVYQRDDADEERHGDDDADKEPETKEERVRRVRECFDKKGYAAMFVKMAKLLDQAAHDKTVMAYIDTEQLIDKVDGWSEFVHTILAEKAEEMCGDGDWKLEADDDDDDSIGAFCDPEAALQSDADASGTAASHHFSALASRPVPQGVGVVCGDSNSGAGGGASGEESSDGESRENRYQIKQDLYTSVIQRYNEAKEEEDRKSGVAVESNAPCSSDFAAAGFENFVGFADLGEDLKTTDGAAPVTDAADGESGADGSADATAAGFDSFHEVELREADSELAEAYCMSSARYGGSFPNAHQPGGKYAVTASGGASSSSTSFNARQHGASDVASTAASRYAVADDGGAAGPAETSTGVDGFGGEENLFNIGTFTEGVVGQSGAGAAVAAEGEVAEAVPADEDEECIFISPVPAAGAAEQAGAVPQQAPRDGSAESEEECIFIGDATKTPPTLPSPDKEAKEEEGMWNEFHYWRIHHDSDYDMDCDPNDL